MSRIRVWDVKTGREVVGPIRAGDRGISEGLSYQWPLFVLREGVVQQIDPITGDSLKRYDSVRDIVKILPSPDQTKLLLQQIHEPDPEGIKYSIVEARNESVLISLPACNLTNLSWINNDYFTGWDMDSNSRVVVDAGSGRVWITKNHILQVGKCGDRTLGVQRSQTKPELEVVDLESNEVIVVFEVQLDWFPDSRHFCFTEDGTALLLDHIIPPGRLATARLNLSDPVPPENVVFSQFEVAPNGRILQIEQNPDLPFVIGQAKYHLHDFFELIPQDRMGFTVTNESGKHLFQETQTLPDRDLREQTHAFMDGGQGLVLLNQDGLNYYRLPSGWKFRPVFWVTLLTPILILLGISRVRRWRSMKRLMSDSGEPQS